MEASITASGSTPSLVPLLDGEDENATPLHTLAELGGTCPVPNRDGKIATFKFRPWRMTEEKEIGQIKAKNQNLGLFVRSVFEYMLTEYNGRDWSSYTAAERKLLINQMSWGNIFYMYVYLRFDALGAEMKMQDMQCPTCTAPISNYVADLSSLEVRTADPDSPKNIIYKLRKPVTVGEVKVTGIKIGYTPWDAMEKLQANTKNLGTVKEAMIAGSVEGSVAEDVGEVNLNKHTVLKELAKRDLEGIYDLLDKHNGGPVLGLEIDCPACAFKWTAALNWTYDYFFGNSSLQGS